MIEDVVVRKSMAEHQTLRLQESNSEIARHLLVHFAGRHVQHHFLLARGKDFETLFQLRNIVLSFSE
jgi:hypothetical protein